MPVVVIKEIIKHNFLETSKLNSEKSISKNKIRKIKKYILNLSFKNNLEKIFNGFEECTLNIVKLDFKFFLSIFFIKKYRFFTWMHELKYFSLL